MITAVRPSGFSAPIVRRAAVALVVILLGGSVIVSTTSAGAAKSERDGTNKTIPTLPTPAPPALPTPSIIGSPSADNTTPPSTEVVVETGIALPAGANITQLFAMASQTLEPTTSLPDSLGRFVVVPEEIPTPAGSTIEAISIYYYGPDAYYIATVRITTGATPGDVAIFYETSLSAAGFVVTSDDVQSAERTRRLQFDAPDSTHSNASVEVLVDGDLGGSTTLTIVDHADPAIMAAFDGWARGLPTIADGIPVSATLSAGRAPEVIVNVSTLFEYDDRSADQLTTQIRDIIANGGGSGFRIDAEDDHSSRILLTHPVIDDPVATITGDDSGTTSMLMIGSLST